LPFKIILGTIKSAWFSVAEWKNVISLKDTLNNTTASLKIYYSSIESNYEIYDIVFKTICSLSDQIVMF